VDRARITSIGAQVRQLAGEGQRLLDEHGPEFNDHSREEIRNAIRTLDGIDYAVSVISFYMAKAAGNGNAAV